MIKLFMFNCLYVDKSVDLLMQTNILEDFLSLFSMILSMFPKFRLLYKFFESINVKYPFFTIFCVILLIATSMLISQGD